MTDIGSKPPIGKSIRLFANTFYYVSLAIIVLFIFIGAIGTASLNKKENAGIQQYGASIFKYPFINRYALFSHEGSSLYQQGFDHSRLFKINACDVSQFNSVKALFSCAKIAETKNSEQGGSKVESAQTLSLSLERYDQLKTYTVAKLPAIKQGESNDKTVKQNDKKGMQHNVPYILLDTFLLGVCLALSLLLFNKARHFLSGYLISLTLLLAAGESKFFYIGSNAIDAGLFETLRISIALLIGPIGLYCFPQADHQDVWRKPQFYGVMFCALLMLVSFQLINVDWYPKAFTVYLASISLSLFVLVLHFIFKFRKVLNTKERKQVLTMVYCLSIGLLLYFPLMTWGGKYGVLAGRYIIVLSIGLGIFFALMRYGLWQVNSLISKSATLSLLSILAFSAWAGLDQGMQVLLNQTLGLSNKTFSAFVAAAISSLFAIPAYQYISKSCDAFFNKDLHMLKRFLSKDILVLAETQKLQVFVTQLGTRLLELSGAHKIELSFIDHNRLSEPVSFNSSKEDKTADYFTKDEVFEYELTGLLSLAFTLHFIDRRINNEIKHELNEGTDEIARALASCTRWNHLEAL